jgi:DNA-directed RNA polymerase subunit RPC12/RpoP
LNFEELAQARWRCQTCDCQRLSDDLLIVAAPQDTALIGELGETPTSHVYDLTGQELDKRQLRCPHCGSAALEIVPCDLEALVTRSLPAAGERRYFAPSRSTSNISVAPGGMSPPAPRAP